MFSKIRYSKRHSLISLSLIGFYILTLSALGVDTNSESNSSAENSGVHITGGILSFPLEQRFAISSLTPAMAAPLTNNQPFNGFPVSLASTDFDPFKYLPQGAEIKNRDKDVIFADLDGDGQQEVTIFYTISKHIDNPKTGILVLRRAGNGYTKFWETDFEAGWRFGEPTGVYDLNKSGKPQIVAYQVVGASCPGSLEIYECRNGKIHRITGGWGEKGHCEGVEIKDLDENGVPEIIIIKTHGENNDIYTWNGKKYILSNHRFPEYYDSRLDGLVQAIYSLDGFPISARLDWTVSAVEIYIIQRRYSEAIQLCYDALRIIEDPHLTQLDSVFPGTKGQATVHSLLGDIYKAAGDLRQAEEHYQKAQTLRVGSK